MTFFACRSPTRATCSPGKVDDVQWLSDDSGLQIWFRVPDDDDQIVTQDGLSLSLDGTTQQTRREIPWRTLGYENEIGSIGEYRYFRANGGGIATLTRRGAGGKSEVLLQGPYLLDYAGIDHESMWCVVSDLSFPSRTRLLIYTPTR